jgi:hypothetical protein
MNPELGICNATTIIITTTTIRIRPEEIIM